MDPDYVLILQELRENIKRISITCSSDRLDLLFRFYIYERTIRIRYEQNKDNTLVIVTKSPLIEVNKSCNNAMWDDLEKILKDRIFPLLSLSIRSLNETTPFLQLGIFHALDVVLGTMDRLCGVIHLKIEGATEFHMFGPIQRMLQYKDDINGIVTLSFRHELDAETMRRASREILSIRSLVLEVHTIDEMLERLPYFSSSNLKFLNLKRRPSENAPFAINLRRVVELAQWRNVERLKMNTFVISTPLRQLKIENKTHVDILLKTLCIQEMAYLQRRFIANPHHIEFRIGFFENRERYIESQWAIYEDGYFLIPHSDEVISVSRNGRVYTFTRIERNRIPTEAEEQLLRQQIQAAEKRIKRRAERAHAKENRMTRKDAERATEQGEN